MQQPGRFLFHRSLTRPNVIRVQDSRCGIAWIYHLSSNDAFRDFINRANSGRDLPSPDAFRLP